MDFTNRKFSDSVYCGKCGKRSAFTVWEMLAGAIIGMIILAIAIPALLVAREAARQSSCAYNLKRIGQALHQYHETYQQLPPAAVWKQGPLRTAALNQVSRIDFITYENWALLLLPQLEEVALFDGLDRSRPIADEANTDVRLTSLATYRCPADMFHRQDNAYRFDTVLDQSESVTFARGNYAINGGTHNHRYVEESAAQPHGDRMWRFLEADNEPFKMIGNGVAGINHTFSFSDFDNDLSTLVALEEIRAGIVPEDPRGVWALGQVGGSITWAHGISGDDCGPNNQWERSDDVLGGPRLHELVGAEKLVQERMPCVSYVDRNDQATARSQHKGGVNVLFMDGAVRFVSDQVDCSLWHVMHSRKTPATFLKTAQPADFYQRLQQAEVPAEKSQPNGVPKAELPAGTTFQNSLEMPFVVLPAGEFQMGLPDVGRGDAPAECPAHPVQITQNFALGQYEVTQQQFLTVLGFNPSYHSQKSDPGQAENSPAETSQFPVEQVSWDQAQEFCQRLSELPAEKAAGRTYRLPTEAEWEYACRSGSSEPYRWSKQRAHRENAGDNAGNTPPLPVTAVGSYPANGFGLHDMRGNVWEWTADWFDRSYYSRSPLRDPQGPATGYTKIVRGSDWIFVAEPCHINYTVMPPWTTSPYIGFRVVCEQTP